MKRPAPLSLLVFLLAACGQAGDLYLPEEAPAAAGADPPAATAQPAEPSPPQEKKKD